MHNTFITELMDWSPSDSPAVAKANRVLERLKVRPRLVSSDRTGRMSRIESRMNLFHLLSQVLAYDVPGDVVEAGTYTGGTAILERKILLEMSPDRELHCFDSFEAPGVQDELLANFERYGLPPPTLHVGKVQDTMPDDLPRAICFSYFDMGSESGSAADEALLHSITHIYPRLSVGAILVINEYADTELYDAQDRWPEYKHATDKFFADKPEDVSLLYSGVRTMGYVRKL